MAKMFKEIHASPMMNIHDSASSLVNPNTKQKLALEESEVGLVKASKFNFNVASSKRLPSATSFGGAGFGGLGFNSDGVSHVPEPSPEAEDDDYDDMVFSESLEKVVEKVVVEKVVEKVVVNKILKEAVVIEKIIDLLGYEEIMEDRGVDKQYALNILYARLLKNKKDWKKLLLREVAKVLDMEAFQEGKQVKQEK